MTYAEWCDCEKLYPDDSIGSGKRIDQFFEHADGIRDFRNMLIDTWREMYAPKEFCKLVEWLANQPDANTGYFSHLRAVRAFGYGPFNNGIYEALAGIKETVETT